MAFGTGMSIDEMQDGIDSAEDSAEDSDQSGSNAFGLGVTFDEMNDARQAVGDGWNPSQSDVDDGEAVPTPDNGDSGQVGVSPAVLAGSAVAVVALLYAGGVL